ncbi:MAG: hypothetical protein U0Z53_15965 [Blastocatellia bacterium]
MKYTFRLLALSLTILGLMVAAETMIARPQGQADHTRKSVPDLTALRTPARLSESVVQAQRNASPCGDAYHHQFDFWIGEWNVKAGGQQAGTNSVQQVSGGCALLENWKGSGGGDGKSLNFYNPATGKWHQLWVGSGGNILELSGEYKDGAMRLAGEKRRPDGARMLTRLTFFNLAADRVRQLWEQSTDEGKTWSVVFDGEYLRKKQSE